MPKVKKSSKRFTLTTDALNAQGFRMLTSGAILDQFNLNPVLLWNHIRPKGRKKNQLLPLGYWDDIKIEDSSITAVPVFDADDDFAMDIYRKVENGTIRMCSAGAEPIEVSDAPEHLVPGQTHATVTKWVLKEASLVDIGANPQSLAVQLYDSHGAHIKLTDTSIALIQPPIHKQMADDKKKEEAKASKAEEEKVTANDEKKKEDLDDKEDTIEKLRKEIEELRAKLNDQEKERKDSEAKNLVALALSEGKITKAQVPHFQKLAALDYEGTKGLIGTLEKHVTLKDRLGAPSPAGVKTKLEKLSEKSWDDLWKSGDLEFVKLNDPVKYRELYAEKFGTDAPA